MRWVQQAALSPHRCAVLPYVGNSSTTKGFLDTGVDVDGIYRIYLSGEFFEHIIPQMGYVPEGKLAGMQAKLDQKDAEIAEIKAERDELQGQLDAVDRLVKHDTWVKSRKPGRPPKKREPA